MDFGSRLEPWFFVLLLDSTIYSGRFSACRLQHLSRVNGRPYYDFMTRASYEYRRRVELLDRPMLAHHQLDRVNALLASILPQNKFYAEKLGPIKLPLPSLARLSSLPYTFKEELVSGPDEHDIARNHTFPRDHYVRFHRTSGTRGRPMVVLDRTDDWQWWIDAWQFVLDVAKIEPVDRVMMAFSFGPFIGFWSANDALTARGALVIPAGGMSTTARLDLLQTSQATVLCCTPTYALRLAEVAGENQIELAASGVTRIIVAGEPGGSMPAIRKRIEQAWQATVIDHSGATEVGPWGYADAEGRGLFVNEADFYPEFHSIEKGEPAGEGELAELILTTLGRHGAPVIRYRTGDLVRPSWNHSGSCQFVFLEGGVLGRVDDMMIIRGVNIYPSSIEQILHSFPEVVEYRITATRDQAMDSLSVEVEDHLDEPERIRREFELRLGLSVDVTSVPLESLPRYEGKGRRFVDDR